MRLVATFSGTTGLVVKLVLLAGVNAVAVWAATVLGTQNKWIPLVVLGAAVLAIDALYLARGKIPAKFLIPGTVFLIAFALIPILYTVIIAFTNYSTGHVLTKQQAISTIELNTLGQTQSSRTYTLSPALDKDGKLVLLLVDDASHKTFVGTHDGLRPLTAAKVSGGSITAAPGYKLVPPFSVDTDNYQVPLPNGSAIHPEGRSAVELKPTLRYDPKADTFTRTSTGLVFHDNGRGSFVAKNGEELGQGWKTYVGFTQFSKIVKNPLYRDPFLRVLLWTVSFAVLCVLLSFALGLFIAITLQKKIRLQRLYRVILILPYAIPSFLTILVWGGLLNDDFGAVNGILGHVGLHVPWLFDLWWARISVILVSVWLTFPYFFLVCLGALQSIPGELTEAARVDGAGPLQVFRKITLPLLLVAVAPLLIASFAFNFNNFNNIFLLTGGGPPTGDNSAAGGTDILISYTYNLAFKSATGHQYSTAAALSIFIFFIVATISGIAFWRSRTLETLT